MREKQSSSILVVHYNCEAGMLGNGGYDEEVARGCDFQWVRE